MGSFSELPLRSSLEVIAALIRLGCYEGKEKAGSHLLLHRQTPDGRTVTGVVVLGKREIPKGTLRNALKQLEIDASDFLEALR